jgi:cobalt/nickel transport system permease protein
VSTFSASLDPYRPAESPLHRLNARVKLPLALTFILVTSLLPNAAWLAYLLLFAILLLLDTISTLGVWMVLKRALVALPFMLAALPILFTGPEPRLTVFSIRQWDLIISQPGLIRLLSITIKAWLSVQAAILLSATTPFSQIAVAMRAMRLPRLFVAVLSLMWRYLFMMVDQTGRLLRARASRSAESAEYPKRRKGGNLIWRARTTGGMAGNLFLRSLERSDRVYAAMLSRGYDGEQRNLPIPQLSRQEWQILTLGILFLMFLAFIGFLSGG